MFKAMVEKVEGFGYKHGLLAGGTVSAIAMGVFGIATAVMALAGDIDMATGSACLFGISGFSLIACDLLGF